MYSRTLADDLENLAMVMMEDGTTAEELKNLIDVAAAKMQQHREELEAERRR